MFGIQIDKAGIEKSANNLIRHVKIAPIEKFLTTAETVISTMPMNNTVSKQDICTSSSGSSTNEMFVSRSGSDEAVCCTKNTTALNGSAPEVDDMYRYQQKSTSKKLDSAKVLSTKKSKMINRKQAAAMRGRTISGSKSEDHFITMESGRVSFYRHGFINQYGRAY